VAIFSSTAFVNTGRRSGGIPVGCFGHQTCHLSLRISAGGTVLARSAHPLARGAVRLMDFSLSQAGLSKLKRARRHRLTVTVTLHDSASKTSAARRMTLIPYSTSGPGSKGSVSESGGLRPLDGVAFASSSAGTGQFLVGCESGSPCRITGAMSVGGHRIAHSATEYVGVDEVGALHFKLTPRGLKMLRSARSNQLPVQIKLRDAGGQLSGRIVLVGYR